MTSLKLDIDEALRYLGAGGASDGELRGRVSAVAKKLSETLRPRWTWRVFPVEMKDGTVRLTEPARQGNGVSAGDVTAANRLSPEPSGFLLPGETAQTMLAECDRAVLLACTLGASFDAMLRAAQVRDMAEAVMLDGCGSAWVEAGCGGAEAEIAARFPGRFLTDRFSPGYGDLPLSVQGELCALLDARRRLGITVTDSGMMNPAKSVTAVVGIADRPQMARIRGCGYCTMRDSCPIRRGGRRCGT